LHQRNYMFIWFALMLTIAINANASVTKVIVEAASSLLKDAPVEKIIDPDLVKLTRYSTLSDSISYTSAQLIDYVTSKSTILESRNRAVLTEVLSNRTSAGYSAHELAMFSYTLDRKGIVALSTEILGFKDVATYKGLLEVSPYVFSQFRFQSTRINVPATTKSTGVPLSPKKTEFILPNLEFDYVNFAVNQQLGLPATIRSELGSIEYFLADFSLDMLKFELTKEMKLQSFKQCQRDNIKHAFRESIRHARYQRQYPNEDLFVFLKEHLKKESIAISNLFIDKVKEGLGKKLGGKSSKIIEKASLFGLDERMASVTIIDYCGYEVKLTTPIHKINLKVIVDNGGKALITPKLNALVQSLD